MRPGNLCSLGIESAQADSISSSFFFASFSNSRLGFDGKVCQLSSPTSHQQRRHWLIHSRFLAPFRTIFPKHIPTHSKRSTLLRSLRSKSLSPLLKPVSSFTVLIPCFIHHQPGSVSSRMLIPLPPFLLSCRHCLPSVRHPTSVPYPLGHAIGRARVSRSVWARDRRKDGDDR
jgi:hypothetical protein